MATTMKEKGPICRINCVSYFASAYFAYLHLKFRRALKETDEICNRVYVIDVDFPCKTLHLLEFGEI